MKATIERMYLATETLGSWYNDGKLIAKTMELPWKDNANNVSCIPEGTYKVVREKTSPKHDYPHLRILNVPKRNGILVHKITYVSGLLGCVGVGSAFQDLNKDGVPDIVGSTAALELLYASLPDEFELEIKEKGK